MTTLSLFFLVVSSQWIFFAQVCLGKAAECKYGSVQELNNAYGILKVCAYGGPTNNSILTWATVCSENVSKSIMKGVAHAACKQLGYASTSGQSKQQWVDDTDGDYIIPNNISCPWVGSYADDGELVLARCLQTSRIQADNFKHFNCQKVYEIECDEKPSLPNQFYNGEVSFNKHHLNGVMKNLKIKLNINQRNFNSEDHDKLLQIYLNISSTEQTYMRPICVSLHNLKSPDMNKLTNSACRQLGYTSYGYEVTPFEYKRPMKSWKLQKSVTTLFSQCGDCQDDCPSLPCMTSCFKNRPQDFMNLFTPVDECPKNFTYINMREDCRYSDEEAVQFSSGSKSLCSLAVFPATSLHVQCVIGLGMIAGIEFLMLIVAVVCIGVLVLKLKQCCRWKHNKSNKEESQKNLINKGDK